MSAQKDALRIARSHAIDAFARLEASVTDASREMPGWRDEQTLRCRLDLLRKANGASGEDLDRIGALWPLRNAIVHAELRFGSRQAIYTNNRGARDFGPSYLLDAAQHDQLVKQVDALAARLAA